MKRILGVLVALAALASTAALWRGVDDRRNAQARQDATQAAARVLDRLDEALKTHLRGLEPKASAAAARPELASILFSLRARDDAEAVVSTLRDGFANESWWEPFRRDFPITALSLSADEPELVLGIPEISAQALLQQTRQLGLASGIVTAGPDVFVATAARIVVPGRPLPAVLLLAAPLDEAALQSLSRQLGAPLLLAEGNRTLASAGGAKAIELMQATLVDANVQQTLIAEGGQWAAGRKPLTSTRTLWVYANTHAAAAEAARTALVTKAVLAAAAFLLVGLALIVGFRGTKAKPHTTSDVAAAPTPQTALGLGAGVPSVAQASASGTQPGIADSAVGLASTAMHEGAGAAGLSVFGRYTLLSPLGEGGMARVFTAVTFGAEGFRRRFVVKRLRPELTNDPAVVAQFIDEAKLGSSMVHSNIIPVFDFGKVGDEYYLATEYILGRDVGRMVQQTMATTGRALTVPVILALAADTLKALDYAHSKRNDSGRPMGLVHRDVSPSNILVSAGGEVKLFDFGIVKAEDRVTQTQHGVVKGNVSFMSPEQARGTAVDARADLFSLGLVMHYAATGQTLYEGGTMYELLVAAAQGPGPREWAKLAALPAPLAEILRRALQVDPDARFASAQEFLAAVAAHQQSHAVNLAAGIQNLFAADFADEERRFSAALPMAPDPDPSDASLPQTGARRS